jgi:tetratricopeptide (TPR) repeat protein
LIMKGTLILAGILFSTLILPISLLCITVISCSSAVPDDEVLLLYARSQDVYREGRFVKAAGMLAGERNFVPALVLRGKAEYLSGDLAAARKSLKRALSIKPGNTEASLFLARLCRETGEDDEAQKLTEKILADNPQDIRALRFAAELAKEKGAAGEAASAVLLDRAVEASAESALVFLDRARLRWIGGNSAGALEDLECARILLSQDNPVMKAILKLESIISEVSQ